MSTTHPTVRTTEWDDLQIKYGNYAPLPPEATNEQLSLQNQELISQIDPLASKNLKALDELQGSDEQLDAEIARHRQKRLEELRLKKQRERFGEVVDVGMCDYVQEITEASKDCVVVCLLYKNDAPHCPAMNHCLTELAKRHRDVKFCRGISDQLVPNYKDSSLPALLIYRDRSCLKQIIGTSFYGGSNNLRPEILEWMLGNKLGLFKTDLLESPLKSEKDRRQTRKGTVLRTGGNKWDSSDDERELVRGRGARARADSDEDSDDADVRANDRSARNYGEKSYGDARVDDVIRMMRGQNH